MSLILALDQSTSATKAILFDDDEILKNTLHNTV